MGVTVSPSHVVSAAPCPSGGGLLTLFPCSSMKDSSYRRQFSTIFSKVSPIHGLQLFMNCPSMSPSHRVQSFRNRLLQRGSPTGSQALPVNLLQRGPLSPQVCRYWQEPAPVWDPHRVTASFEHPPALVWGAFHGLQVDICSTMERHGLQGKNLPHHGLHHELQGKSLCSNILGTSSPSSFFTDLGVCRVVPLT